MGQFLMTCAIFKAASLLYEGTDLVILDEGHRLKNDKVSCFCLITIDLLIRDLVENIKSYSWIADEKKNYLDWDAYPGELECHSHVVRFSIEQIGGILVHG